MIFPKRILAFVLISITAAVVFFSLKKESELPASQAEVVTATSDIKRDESLLPVRVALVTREDMVETIKSPGEAITEKMATVRAKATGTIKNLRVREGQYVLPGQILVEMDDREFRLRLDQKEAHRLRCLSELFLDKQFQDPEKKNDAEDGSQAVIRQAEEGFNRASELFCKGLLSMEKFEQAKREYDWLVIKSGERKDEVMASAKGLTQAEIEVRLAQMDLEKTVIRAPFAGIITDLRVSPQENIEAGRELFTLVNLREIKVRARVLESEIGRISVGREADLKFIALPKKVFAGKIEAISPVINPEERTCAVYILVANSGNEIKPGMQAEVEVAAERYKDKLLIPQEAVLVRSGRKLVFVVEEGTAKWRYIETGLENEDFAEVLAGVSEGEQVIVEGHFALIHEARVRILR